MSVYRNKLIALGDSEVGKTCLLKVFARDVFATEHEPTIFQTYVAGFRLGKKNIELALWDTAGDDFLGGFRPLSYPGSEVILVCFSLVSPDSLESVKTKWIHEIRHYCPGIPFILVGTKSDLREDPDVISELASVGDTPIDYEHGLALARELNAYGYVECSAKTRVNLRELFVKATRAAWTIRKSAEGKCALQ